MILSHEHKFMFIKTRKTAGSSLEKCLFPYLNPETDICTGGTYDDDYPSLNYPLGWQTHISLHDLSYICNDTEFHHILDNYFVFTIERNPWDKAVSVYYWMQKTRPKIINDMTFSQFIRHDRFAGWVDDSDSYSYRNYSINKIYDFNDLDGLRDKMFQMGIDIRESFSKTRLKQGSDRITDYHEMYKDERDIILVGAKMKKVIDKMGYSYD